MKLLHTSDWHLGRTLSQYSLLDDQRHFLDQFIRCAVEQHVGGILIAGDLYNRSVPGSAAVELLDEALSRLVTEHGIPVAAIAGNHDSPERLSFCSRMLRGAGLYIEGVLKKQIASVTLGDGPDAAVCYLLPYFTPADARAVLEDDEISTYNDAFAALMRANIPLIDRGKTNILVAHGFFTRLSGRESTDAVFSASELSVGALDLVDLSPAAGVFDYIALGHLHAPQRAGAENARYAGSPLKYSLSERLQRKSVTLLDVVRKGEIRQSEITLPPLRDVRLIEGAFDELLAPPADISRTDDYVYANIVGDEAVLYAMQKLRRVYPNILGLSFISSQPENQDAARAAEVTGRGVEDLFCEFYQYVTGSALSVPRAQIVRALALETEAAQI